MRKILVHRTHMWSETISDLLSHPNAESSLPYKTGVDVHLVDTQYSQIKEPHISWLHWHRTMPWKAQVTSSKSALRASSPLVTSPKLTLDSFSKSFIKWWPLPSSCWMISNFSPTFLFPSRFEAKLYYILISSFNLNCWTGYHHHAAPFNNLFVANTMNRKLSCICDQNTWHYIYAILFVCYTTR